MLHGHCDIGDCLECLSTTTLVASLTTYLNLQVLRAQAAFECFTVIYLFHIYIYIFGISTWMCMITRGKTYPQTGLICGVDPVLVVFWVICGMFDI